MGTFKRPPLLVAVVDARVRLRVTLPRDRRIDDILHIFSARAKCHSGTPACRRTPCPAVPSPSRSRPYRQGVGRRRAADGDGSSPERPHGPGPRNSVAREHGRDDVTIRGDFPGRSPREWAGVADASRAAIADEWEAELFEFRQEARFRQVLGDDLRSRGRGSF